MKHLQTVTAIMGLLGASLLHAAGPVAIVEDVQGASAKVEVMDFLHAGQQINLAKGESLTIGYMDSCKRERIKGGNITIGEKQSKVQNGMVIREDVECDGGQANIAGQAGVKAGTLAFRSAPGSAGLQKPKSEIFGSAPVLVLPEAGQHITIKNLRDPKDTHELTASGKHVDLADHNIDLTLGQVYEVTAGSHSTTFKVSTVAEQGKKAPIISRLVRL